MLRLVRLVSLGLAGKYSHITEFTLPKEAKAGEEFSFKVSGHLDEYTRWPNFAVGFAYIDGPVDKVKVKMDGKEYEIVKNGVVCKYTKYPANPCVTIPLDLSMTLEEGTYKFAAVTGYVDTVKGGFYYDDRIDKSVEVSKPKPPGPTTPPGWPEWLPWWTIPLAGGLVAVVAVAAVAMENERRRFLELMLLRK